MESGIWTSKTGHEREWMGRWEGGHTTLRFVRSWKRMGDKSGGDSRVKADCDGLSLGVQHCSEGVKKGELNGTERDRR